MNKADPIFVRCIKPNSEQHKQQFEKDLVRRQLKYNGVLGIAKIRNRGYPVRVQKRDFVKQ